MKVNNKQIIINDNNRQKQNESIKKQLANGKHTCILSAKHFSTFTKKSKISFLLMWHYVTS